MDTCFPNCIQNLFLKILPLYCTSNPPLKLEQDEGEGEGETSPKSSPLERPQSPSLPRRSSHATVTGVPFADIPYPQRVRAAAFAPGGVLARRMAKVPPSESQVLPILSFLTTSDDF